MKKIKLLFVESDETFAFMVKETFAMIGSYEICTTFDGFDGLKGYHSFEPDVIVTAVRLPIMGGKEMVRKIREKDRSIPIIFSASCHTPEDFISGIKAGATVVLRKPLLPEELDMQIRALLNLTSSRQLPITEEGECLIGTFGFDATNQYLTWKGKRISLTPTEAKIMQMLIVSKGLVVNRNNILSALGKNCDYYASRMLDVYVNRLRKLLSKCPSARIITSRGRGYMLEECYL